MDGATRDLEPKVLQVLIALASVRPSVVSRDRLIEQCWDGRIVGDDALNRCIVALRHLAREFSPEPFAIETVPRGGYSLVERPARNPGGTGIAKTMLAFALVVSLLMLGTLAYFRFGSERAEAAPASIAVLPFRNLSTGDSYFADGVGEEVLNTLSREPQFRVAGRASSGQFGKDPDVRDVARRLNVDYVLEGSVRSQGGRVRVNADLVRASDRVRLWSGSFDGTLNDIFVIQTAIGDGVATGLRRQLIHSPAKARPVNGEAYALYLNARGLLRTENPQSGQDAIPLLREAIRLDPSSARSWAGLADALYLDARTKGNDGLVAALPQAKAAARHALELDPYLAEAHGSLAELLGYETPEAFAHLRRAAALEIRTGEGQMWLSEGLVTSGQFADSIEALRRAHELDPLWPFPLRALIDDLAASGDRAAAEAMIKKAFPDDATVQDFAMARVARMVGDFSEAARRWSVVAKSESRWAVPSKLGLQEILFTLSLAKDVREPSGRALIGGSRFVAAPPITAAPSASEWRKHSGSFEASLVFADENALAAKRMLREGRTRELVATYDGGVGLLRIRKGESVRPLRVRDAPIIALALREQGRFAEADDLLRRSDATIRTVYAYGKVPIFFDEDAAGVWATQGKTNLALGALERALGRGWLHVGHTDFPRLEDEPVFRSLRGNPRFEALLNKRAAHFAKERAETARALKIRLSS